MATFENLNAAIQDYKGSLKNAKRQQEKLRSDIITLIKLVRDFMLLSKDTQVLLKDSNGNSILITSDNVNYRGVCDRKIFDCWMDDFMDQIQKKIKELWFITFFDLLIIELLQKKDSIAMNQQIIFVGSLLQEYGVPIKLIGGKMFNNSVSAGET